jgi:hypothetical protein
MHEGCPHSNAERGNEWRRDYYDSVTSPMPFNIDGLLHVSHVRSLESALGQDDASLSKPNVSDI